MPEGEFTQESAAAVEQSLTAKDKDNLEQLANKIIDQQTAAAGVVSAIRVTMPEPGVPLVFRRALQIDPEGRLSVQFRASSGLGGALLRNLWPAALLFAALWVLLAARGAGRRARAGA